VSYSLLLIEPKQPTHSLSHTLNGKNYRVVTISSVDELSIRLRARLPDAIVIGFGQPSVDPAIVNAAIADVNVSIPCVMVVDGVDALPPDGSGTGITVCSRSNIAPTLNAVLKNSPLVRVGSIALDTKKNTLWAHGTLHHLTPKLSALMKLFIQNEGKIVYRATIMRKIWKTEYMGDTRTLDVHVRWLREKLEMNPSRPQILLTVRGAGYRLIAPDA